MMNLGLPAELANGKSAVDVIANAVLEVIGLEGTFITPTFTYSFCNREIFDPINTPSDVGAFGEVLRKKSGFQRSLDPIFSVTGCGKKIDKLFADLPNDCFGVDCIYDRLSKMNAKVCNIGLSLFFLTPIHHLEQMIGVPYRFRKTFTGYIRQEGNLRKETWIYNVRMMDDYSMPNCQRLDDIARKRNICSRIPVGRGYIFCASIQDLYELARQEVEKNPWYLAVGPACNPLESEEKRVTKKSFIVQLPEKASMKEMIDGLWELPRDIISDGYDSALEALSGQIPMQIHNYETGNECFTWIIPEKWTCHEARLETIKGKVLFSYTDNPLHVISYSLPFEGVITCEELLKHLYVHPRLTEAIPFVFKYYERDWGLCCTQVIKDSLKDDFYRVKIDTEFSYGTLKVGEIVVKGETDECLVLCAHLCHPAMVNDDLTGVVAGLDLMREILEKKNLRYTYRFIILPETIGSAAYLSHNQDAIKNMQGGLFLEMLGTPYPHALQLSLQGDTQLDKCIQLVVKENDPYSWTGKFLEVVLNDERMFNAPGINVPMLSLSRILPRGTEGAPYPEYHTSFDNPDRININNLKSSRDLVLKIIDAWENNRIPCPNFRGELFFSRFRGIDYATMEEELFKIMFCLNGEKTVVDIAWETGISLTKAFYILDIFNKEKLIYWL
ncbi:MAG: DUF4910 domain-containing protein [Syntrophomonas sp.]